MAEAKPVILIVEDDLDVADMLNAYFRVQGYEVLTVNWGEDAIRSCNNSLPALVILDIRLPDIDGYEVARRLRSNRRTKEIPIIFLTEKRNRADRLQGLELGADDYITKPFDVQELRLRVRNALRRSAQGTLTNPVTNLPEGPLVEERLEECLEKEDWALLMVSLENLDGFRETYGFVASDDVLRAISLMIHNAVRDLGGTSDFVGQLSPTEFVIVTHPGALSDLTERIRLRLEQSLDYFYPIKDRAREEKRGKRLSIRINQLQADQGPFKNLGQLKAQLSKQRV
ncbi:MAG: response regulator [Chloroflexota bacterium]|nr:MAG: response regulator [Chloroflexota bacterium]